jgi:hypothetical protein
MKQTICTVVRDDGVAGSNPATPRPERTTSRITSLDSPALVARFWAKVALAEPDQCWPWTGAISRNGYGSIKINGKAASAHRVAYSVAHGHPPAGLLIRHKCDNRACCNPQHLETGNHVENARDMVERGRSRNGRLAGEKNPRAKLNGEAVARIREAFTLGQTNIAIAKKHGVTHSMISNIRRGKNWVS